MSRRKRSTPTLSKKDFLEQVIREMVLGERDPYKLGEDLDREPQSIKTRAHELLTIPEVYKQFEILDDKNNHKILDESSTLEKPSLNWKTKTRGKEKEILTSDTIKDLCQDLGIDL